jgi:glycerol-3-phosphate acyltransferase PlsY
MSFWYLFAFCTASYLIGGINFSIILCKTILKDDITKKGSGNPGASNMLRNFGFKWGITILVLDMLKSAIPALVGLLLYGNGYDFNPLHLVTNTRGLIAMYSCGLAAVLGHCFPIWTKFKGGKGISSIVGVFFIANPLLTVFGIFFGMFLVGVTHYAVFSSFIFIVMVTLFEGLLKHPPMSVCAFFAAFYVLVLFTHRPNLYRILNEQEKQASLFKKKK